MAPKVYVVYGSPAAGSVLITADALGIALDIEELAFEKGEHLTPEYLKLNPQHTVPTLVDGDVVIFDSHAINAYLVGKYGKTDALYPKDLVKRALVDQRLYFDCSLLFPPLRNIDLGYIKKEIKEVPTALAADVKTAYEFLEKFLEGHRWVAGNDFTIADIHIASTLSCLDYHVKVDPKTSPNTTEWMKRTWALPCFASHAKTISCFTVYFDSLK